MQKTTMGNIGSFVSNNHHSNGDIKPTTPFTFFLGTDNVNWLTQTDVPLFIAYNTVCRKRLIRSHTTWALDSGGFNELDLYGRWTVSPGTYASRVRWIYDHVPGLQWAACQDWVCPPFIIEKTGLSVPIHQQNTVNNYLRLCELQPTLPWAPVLQGWCIGEYIDHIRQYEEVGIDLTVLPIVGIGSIASRQHADADLVEQLIREVASTGIKLHAFGVKTTGLRRYAHLLTSADSVTWSLHARIARIRLPECTHNTKDCSSCLTWALKWREEMLTKISTEDVPSSNIIRLQRHTPQKTTKVDPVTARKKGYIQCRWPNCSELFPPDRWYCTQHWKALPLHIRKQILKPYAPNLWVDGQPPQECLKAVAVADNWVQANHFTSPSS